MKTLYDGVSVFSTYILIINPPQFITTPNGNTVAQWRRDKDSDLIIEFLPDFTLYFILVYPEDFKTTMTFCGCCTFETFKKIMKPFNLYWVKK